ncbi:PREDICTED: odorant receptor 46a, isoform A [Polistes canadensis]|uniref:odorant receptor 46a, isoform A n=1 Tax=Polistes canadensis TaxID=91411 RepID=UPI000718C08D|nr:PREDICTED: odorant receptor 46a, isoform A [Polistes canadensis]
MDILPVNFKIFTFCGIWRERDDLDIFMRLINFFHGSMVITIIFYFTLTELIEIIVSRNDLEDVTESLFMALTFLALCFKLLNILFRKRKLLILLNLLREKICRPRNVTEEKILESYSRRGTKYICWEYKILIIEMCLRAIAKWCTLSFMALSETTAVAFVLAPIMELHRSNRVLPYNTYLPYSIEELHAYLVTYLIHTVSIIYGALLNVSFDSLVYGLTLHVCGQIAILSERCTQTLREGNSNEIKECVRHYVFIHGLVKRIESLFIWTIAVLFLFSLITLCTTIFQMSKKNPLTVEFLSFVLYTGSMMFQIFCYCWYGNELRLKSKEISDAIYNSKWIMSTPNNRRNLQLLMRVSQKELTLTYHRIFSLNLDVFTWVRKHR